MCNLNRESFMTILGKAWNKWSTPEEALLEPAVSSPPSSSGSSVLLSSPVGVRKNTSAYYLYKLNKSLELIEELQSTSVTPNKIQVYFLCSDVSRDFLGRPVHTSNPRRCHHGCH